MKILALDTSTEFLSLALWLDGELVSRDVLVGQAHSQQILPLLRDLLEEASISLHALDGIAFGAGPGSFTGLRIGCGIAQGLAFGANLPVIGIGTLVALAETVNTLDSNHDRIIACLDARMGEVYLGAYQKRENLWHETLPVALYKPDNVPVLAGERWVGAGSGWTAYQPTLMSCYKDQIGAIQPDISPVARSIVKLALPMFESGHGVAAAEATPIYIRNKVALKMSERGSL